MRTRDPNRHYLRGGKIYGRGYLPHSALPGGGGTSGGDSTPESIDLPSIAKLADHVSELDAESVRRMQAADERSSAKAIYERRLAELEQADG